jgi:hypothetical protein
VNNYRSAQIKAVKDFMRLCEQQAVESTTSPSFIKYSYANNILLKLAAKGLQSISQLAVK